MISLPIINAFISAGAFKTWSVLHRITKDELLEVYIWCNAEKHLIPRPPGPIFKDTLGFMSSLEPMLSISDSIDHGNRFHTHTGRKRDVGTFICGCRSGREDKLHAINKNACKPQNKQIFAAGISIWSNSKSHLCPKVKSIIWCHQQQLEESQERKEMYRFSFSK